MEGSNTEAAHWSRILEAAGTPHMDVEVLACKQGVLPSTSALTRGNRRSVGRQAVVLAPNRCSQEQVLAEGNNIIHGEATEPKCTDIG